MKLLQEFQQFAMRGNVVDMAVGVIIGGAFGKIVTSLVNDVLMPPIGMLTGGIDFKQLAFTMKEAVGEQPAVSVKYGMFINTIIDFTIVAFVIFMVIRALNSLKKKEAAAPSLPPPAPSNEELLLRDIRDLLKTK